MMEGLGSEPMDGEIREVYSEWAMETAEASDK